ncbi:hypothetical protein ATCV1_z308L [Acanthocystis turfacea chlorella virus 1]|uniref:Uncharacterized protein z308L n=1 Tax=Chlorovirus heliozoae TaxID=322019 RepID=A7K8R8_9PHYC|nr:hypothetical protein ATCV1_z308L [Acanthocystis turfacea chlorella virus 1]ABT16442.1 hypothetical protein ATCV1_z308L [Acanthocystis turfacea chlorella virus 1]
MMPSWIASFFSCTNSRSQSLENLYFTCPYAARRLSSVPYHLMKVVFLECFTIAMRPLFPGNADWNSRASWTLS